MIGLNFLGVSRLSALEKDNKASFIPSSHHQCSGCKLKLSMRPEAYSLQNIIIHSQALMGETAERWRMLSHKQVFAARLDSNASIYPALSQSDRHMCTV